MPLCLTIPGRAALDLDLLILDVNGTLTDRGDLIEGVSARLEALRDMLDVHLLSADTFGTLDSVALALGIEAQVVTDAHDKLRVVEAFGPERCVAVGNGANDALMLARVALGIAVVGPEGASSATITAADIVCHSIGDALDLLREPRLIAATLRT